MHTAAARKIGVVIVLSLVATFSQGQQNTQTSSGSESTNSQQTAPQPAPVQAPAPDGSATPSAPTQTPSAGDAPATDSPANDQQDLFVFKRQVDEVVLHATVVDEQRRLAAHLDRSAFTVFDNGVKQTITSFHRDDVPVAIGIVIDNSSSMRPKRDQVNQAVLNLIRASNPRDQVFVVNFSQSPYLDQDFTSDISLLERALQRTSAQGSTALYDAIVASAIHLKSGPQLEKKILLVITDGKDNMSQATLQEATRNLQERNGPVLYAIGLTDAGRRNSGREALQSLADATGGSAFFPETLDQVGDITEALAHDIRSQYTLAYEPQNQSANSNYHPVEVEARASGYRRLTVRTRNGYYTGESVR